MADRLTQLQVCVDQLVAQFNSTVNYVNTQSELGLLDPDPTSVVNLAANAPLPGKKDPDSGTGSAPPQAPAAPAAPFNEVINELATDLILKSRQISMLIDLLPGINMLPETQIKLISELVAELETAEAERVQKIREKDNLLRWTEDLIQDISNGIRETRGI